MQTAEQAQKYTKINHKWRLWLYWSIGQWTRPAPYHPQLLNLNHVEVVNWSCNAIQSKSAACYIWFHFALEITQHMSEMILKKVVLTHFACTLCTLYRKRQEAWNKEVRKLAAHIYICVYIAHIYVYIYIWDCRLNRLTALWSQAHRHFGLQSTFLLNLNKEPQQ